MVNVLDSGCHKRGIVEPLIFRLSFNLLEVRRHRRLHIEELPSISRWWLPICQACPRKERHLCQMSSFQQWLPFQTMQDRG